MMQLGPGVQYNTPYRRDGIIPEKTHQLFVEHVEGVQHSLYLQSLNYVMLSMRPHPATTMLPTYGEMPPPYQKYMRHSSTTTWRNKPKRKFVIYSRYLPYRLFVDPWAEKIWWDIIWRVNFNSFGTNIMKIPMNIAAMGFVHNSSCLCQTISII